MDKQKILIDYKKQEDKMLLAQILDKIEFSKQREKLEYTDFLDMYQVALVKTFMKKIDFESGVTVSVKHLCNNLDTTDISYEIVEYYDDEDLYKKALNCKSRCINLQVPSFSDETLEKILKVKDNVVISIHSTLCNLQVEEGSLIRLLNLIYL